MDSADNCEKSLPGVSMPRWMKRAPERFDYSDICSTPPSDGFFYLNNRHRSGHNKTAVECIQSQKRRTSRGETSPDLGSAIAHIEKRSTSIECTNSDTSNFFNTVSNKSLANLASTQAALNILPARLLQLNTGVSSEQITPIAPNHFHNNMDKRQDKNDSAMTPIDTPAMILTNTDEGGSRRLVDKFSGSWSVPCTPDVTPCSTPSITPTCSPQVSRRSGNPFFTGGPVSNSAGSWLFRPANEQDKNRKNILYEAKVEVQQQPNSQPLKKTVRYVPRPSELRELNFWSPTSM